MAHAASKIACAKRRCGVSVRRLRVTEWRLVQAPYSRVAQPDGRDGIWVLHPRLQPCRLKAGLGTWSHLKEWAVARDYFSLASEEPMAEGYPAWHIGP